MIRKRCGDSRWPPPGSASRSGPGPRSVTRRDACSFSPRRCLVQWPRRTAGNAIRQVAYTDRTGTPAARSPAKASIQARISSASSLLIPAINPSSLHSLSMTRVRTPPAREWLLRDVPACLDRLTRRTPHLARALGEGDYDVLIDLAGMAAGTGALPAARARAAHGPWQDRAMRMSRLSLPTRCRRRKSGRDVRAVFASRDCRSCAGDVVRKCAMVP